MWNGVECGETLEGTAMSRLLACALLVLAASPAAADRWERTIEVTGRPTFVLHGQDASVSVRGSDRPTIGIRVTTHGWSIGPKAVEVEGTRSGNRVVLEVTEPHPRLSINFNGAREVQIEVEVPRESDLDLTSGDGPISVESVAGTGGIRCGDGAISAEGLRGDLRLATGNGAITGRDLDGRLSAESSDGRVSVDGRFDHLEVRTRDGRVLAVARPGSQVADGWTLRSGDGTLTLRVPPDLRSDLFLRSSGGGIRVRLPVEPYGEMGRHEVRGRLNGGGALLEMRTGDGVIRLERG